jgi:hypothetical protein
VSRSIPRGTGARSRGYARRPEEGTVEARPLDAVDWNYWQATVAFSAWSQRGEARQRVGYVLADVGAPVAEFNTALVADPDGHLEEALVAAREFFGERRHPYRVSFRAEHAEAHAAGLAERGYTRVEDVPGMELGPLPQTVSIHPDVSFRIAEDASGLDAFRKTAFSGFGLPAEAAHLFLTDELLTSPAFTALVGTVQGAPVCTSALYLTEGVAGIYWVATLDTHRKRGFGEAATWAAVAEGVRRGYARASLQASVMGKPVYARMGFDHDRSYARFEAPVADG